MSDSEENISYSKAFDNFVGKGKEDESDDLVGLLAYALYKKAIRDEVAQNGRRSPGAQRNPPPSTVEVYKSASAEKLQNFALRNIEGATPEIQESAVSQSIDSVRSELDASLGQLNTNLISRTSWASTIVANVAAWVITLFIAVVVVYGVQVNITDTITDVIERAISDQQQEGNAQLPLMRPDGISEGQNE